MAYEASVTIRQGEKVLVYGEASVDSGTLTYTSGGTFTLYDAAGEAVSGLDEVSVTGGTSGAASTVQNWYLLDTADLEPAAYYAIFKFEVSQSVPAASPVFRSDIEIIVLPPVERPATFDLSTKVGETRWWMNDFSTGFPGVAAVFSDAELTLALKMSTVARTVEAGIPILAAALLFDRAANTAATVASIKQIAIFRTDTRSVPDELRKAADRLRQLYASYGVEDPGDTLIDANGVAIGMGVVTVTEEIIPRVELSEIPPVW